MKLFDDQHQGLFKLIDGLFEAMNAGKGEAILGNLLTSLEKYTVTHFQEEEKFMMQNNDPDLDAHILEHKAFIKKIAEFKSNYDMHKVGLSVELLQFLKNWLLNHIKITDKKYGDFMSGNNPK